MFAEIDTYDWAEVFGEGGGGNCTPIQPNRPPGSPKSLSNNTFSRDLLLHAMLLFDEGGGIIVGHVHDEVILWHEARVITPDGIAEQETLET